MWEILILTKDDGPHSWMTIFFELRCEWILPVAVVCVRVFSLTRKSLLTNIQIFYAAWVLK